MRRVKLAGYAGKNLLKWIEIDLRAIRSNLNRILAEADHTKIMAVLKADAYGHGLVSVAQEAENAGISYLGVLTLEEARNLRRAKISRPICLMAPILPRMAEEAVKFKISATVDHLDQIRALNAKASLSSPVSIHVDLDFGLGRWGISPGSLNSFLERLKRFKKIQLQGLSAHIDYIAGKNAVEAEEKLRDFNRIAQRLKKKYPGLISHAANSSVFLDFPHWRMDMARIGNLIYGINAAKSRNFPLENPWHFKARIIHIRSISAGESVGYASAYVSPRKMKAATLLVGYSDGVTMEPAERLIRFGSGFEYWGIMGKVKTPFIGGCGISHLLVDVSRVPRVKIGDAVTLPVRRTAAHSQIPRVYVS